MDSRKELLQQRALLCERHVADLFQSVFDDDSLAFGTAEVGVDLSDPGICYGLITVQVIDTGLRQISARAVVDVFDLLFGDIDVHSPDRVDKVRDRFEVDDSNRRLVPPKA